MLLFLLGVLLHTFDNLVPRVSHLTASYRAIAPGDGKMRDPGDEVAHLIIWVRNDCFNENKNVTTFY